MCPSRYDLPWSLGLSMHGGPELSMLVCVDTQDADDYSSNYVERDERRLAELGRRAVEMYAVAHIFSELDSAYSEAESIKRQDALIKEVCTTEILEIGPLVVVQNSGCILGSAHEHMPSDW